MKPLRQTFQKQFRSSRLTEPVIDFSGKSGIMDSVRKSKTERNVRMNLDQLREQIDIIDNEILGAFEKRMDLCRQVAL